MPSKKYGDELLSAKKNLDETTTNTFLRHGLTYVDIIKKKKLIERHVLDKGRGVYRYPVQRSNVRASKIYLKSGNNFLSKTAADAINIINDDLPIINKHFWGRGIALTSLTDSSYIIKPTEQNTGTSKFYISTSDNYEEIQNDKGFIADSLVLPIR